MHFTLGAAFALAGFLLGGMLNFWVGLGMAAASCVGMAFGKEYYDRTHNGRFDCIDLGATVLGGVLVLAFMVAAYYWVF